MSRFLSALGWKRRPSPAGKRHLNLALQGGGALGAFTWGVIDRLLEEDLEIAAVSGASAGAMNAAALVSGMAQGGKPGARQILRAFWEDVGAQDGATSSGWLARMNSLMESTMSGGAQASAQLATLVNRHIDTAAIRQQTTIRILVSTTDLSTEKPCLFRAPDITPDVLLASAALPMVHKPVEINGRPHMDGGLSLNPPLTALMEESPASETLLIRLIPFGVEPDKNGPFAAMARNAQMAFNRGLVAELEHWHDLQSLAADAKPGSNERLDRIRAHHISEIDGAALMPEGAMAKALHPTPALIQDLFDRGVSACETWLSETVQT